jgi:hypothetical protein
VVKGHVDFAFRFSASEKLTVVGAIDLPIVRIPIEYDWKDP